MEVPIELCQSAKVYRKDPIRRYLLLSVLIAIYAISIPYCYFTAGEPRKAAMIAAQKLADEKWALESSSLSLDDNLINTNVTTENNIGSVIIDMDFNENGQQIDDIQSKLSQPYIHTVDEDDDEFNIDHNHQRNENVVNTETKSSSLTTYISSFFGPSKESRRAKADFEKWQKEFKEKSGSDAVSLPPEYLPSAWACLALFVSLSLHALFFLLGHWIVQFKAFSLFKPSKVVEKGCFVLVTPPPNRGTAALVEVLIPSSNSNAISKSQHQPNSKMNVQQQQLQGLQIEFQRQKYNYIPSSQLGDSAKKFPNGVFSLSTYPIALPITHYIQASGIKSETELEKLTILWGKNHLAVAIPSFLELLQLQLLSPLAIFQVFCALLWLLDEYWSFTLFSLVSVVIYEGTTVFQRTRTQKMLGGMSPKPSPVYAYRCSAWKVITTKDLLPGDIISLSYKKQQRNQMKKSNSIVPTTSNNNNSNNNTVGTTSPISASGTNNNVTIESADSNGSFLTSRDEIIPCDCLLIRGKAVVNEASLTGESVPQMKEALSVTLSGNKQPSVTNNNKVVNVEEDQIEPSIDNDKLDMNGLNRVNVLFSGCSFVTIDAMITSSSSNINTGVASSTNSTSISSTIDTIPPAPDRGALAYVLRTGFGSSQGTLLQMIEFSQQSVSGDSKETGLALLMLFIFALFASGYVLKIGLEKKEKTTHELLIKCVIIITSVVPRQFPMQMAMAVNMALMSLTKAGIFCTEPYRVPLAGKVTHCLFDKTGTLTTDQLVPVGIVNHNTLTDATPVPDIHNNSISSSMLLPELGAVISATAETALILAACHSLVVVEEDNIPDTTTTIASNNGTTPDDLYMAINSNANLVGDPIELAAIKAIDWNWNAKTSTASPDGAVKRSQLALSVATQQLKKLEQDKQTLTPQELTAANHTKKVEAIKNEIKILEGRIEDAKSKLSTAIYSSVQVIQRHHFSSKLQRMSVVCRCSRNIEVSPVQTTSSSSSISAHDVWYCLVKGSPEAIRHLLIPESIPLWYTKSYESLARRGLRVLALAFKKVSTKDIPADQPRSWVESQLLFGGFIAFECKIRADSGIVMKALIQADHKVAMITGDSLLTSLHVAKKVHICDHQLNALTLTITNTDQHNNITTNSASTKKKTISDFSWLLYNEETSIETVIPFDLQSLPQLSTTYNLLTTEEAFLALVAVTGGKASTLWNYAGCFKVFARMSPQGKASIIRAIQDVDKDFHVFMCGDGGNDVGALKQADIGLALLAGHANANTTEELQATTTNPTTTNLLVDSNHNSNNSTATSTSLSVHKSVEDDISAEDALNNHQKKLSLRSEAFNKARSIHMKEFQAKYTKEQQVQLQIDIKQRTEAGEFMSLFSLMKDQANKLKQALNEENQRYMALHGHVWDPKRDGDGLGGSATGGSKTAVEQMMETMDSSDAGGLPMVRPGDASVAAPFTSRIPSVRAVVDLIRQGRCTLLSALMQQQIMMLESCIAAYTLSALSLHNARSSERQMMASSWLIMTAAVSFSYAAPLEHMHPLRPLRSLFHPAIIISTLGQAAIHIACMTLAVKWATDAMGPEALKEVTEFFRKAKANEIARDAHCGEDDLICQLQAYWQAPFLPNLLNSVVFLVETSQMISVFFANYKGRPWMKGMLENHPLFLSVFACIGGVIIAAWELIPQLNNMIQLAPFPNDYFRYKVLLLVISTILGTFLWDRLCVMIFAPQVFQASMGEAGKTSFKDFWPILMTLLKVGAVLILLGTGNILLIIGAIWYYRNYTNSLKEKELQAVVNN